MVNGMVPFHEHRGELFQREEAQRSIGMAMQTLMLVALDLGYQSCPMVAIGKGLKEPWPKPNRLPLADVVYENIF